MTQFELLILEHAATELYKIRQHATNSEFKKLVNNIDNLNGGEPDACIYGQMTGDCFSSRACLLIDMCAVPVFFNTLELGSGIADNRGWNHFVRRFSPLEVALKQRPNIVKSLLREIADAEFPTA